MDYFKKELKHLTCTSSDGFVCWIQRQTNAKIQKIKRGFSQQLELPQMYLYWPSDVCVFRRFLFFLFKKMYMDIYCESNDRDHTENTNNITNHVLWWWHSAATTQFNAVVLNHFETQKWVHCFQGVLSLSQKTFLYQLKKYRKLKWVC